MKNKDEWVEAVNKLSNELLDFSAIDNEDSYGLNEVLEDDEIIKTDPQEFLNEYFHEDLASIAYDEHLRKESKHYEEDTDDW
jgi:hypothetical protein